MQQLEILIGSYFIVVGLSVIINHKAWIKLTLKQKNKTPLILLGGIMSFLVGMILLLITAGVETKILLSMVIWAALVKGLLLLLLPEKYSKKFMNAKIFHSENYFIVTGIITIAFGFFFILV